MAKLSRIEINLHPRDRELLERFVEAVEKLARETNQPTSKLPNLIGE